MATITTFNISKDVYFASIKNSFKTNIDLLNALVKQSRQKAGEHKEKENTKKKKLNEFFQ